MPAQPIQIASPFLSPVAGTLYWPHRHYLPHTSEITREGSS